MKTFYFVLEWKDPSGRSPGFDTELLAVQEAEKLARDRPGHYFSVCQVIARCHTSQPIPPIHWQTVPGVARAAFYQGRLDDCVGEDNPHPYGG